MRSRRPSPGAWWTRTGAPVGGAQVSWRGAGGVVTASSDPAGNFRAVLPAAGEYALRVERPGFFVFTDGRHAIEAGSQQVTIRLNHLQEFADKIDVTYSPPAIDPQQTSERKELTNTEIQGVPYPAPQDFRNALPLLNGVVQDNAGRVHFNGGDTNQANYTLDGFNISDPVTGRLEARINIESIQSMDLEGSRYAADNGRGSTGVLDLKTRMGDDRWRFGGTNFIPGVSAEGGLYVNKWTPRLEFSGPIVKGRAWFHNGLDAFYNVDSVHGLPHGENRTSGLSGSNLSRFHVNITPANILTASFLYNLTDTNRNGLSILNPAETTTNIRQATYMSTIRDQHYFGGALLDVGFADTRGLLRNPPRGDVVYEITPSGNRGNYFSGVNRHWYRQQVTANLFLPTVHFHGEHHLKFGVDVERESFHQQVDRHDYQVLRGDDSVARLVTFAGIRSRIARTWRRRSTCRITGRRAKGWRSREACARNGTKWCATWKWRRAWPWRGRRTRLRGTKISAGWGVYYDAISLGTLARGQGQMSFSTFFLPDGVVRGPVPTSFEVNDRALSTPKYQTANLTLERKLPFDFYAKAGYTWRQRRARVRVRYAVAANRADVLRWRGVPVEQLAARPLRRGGFRGPAHLCGAVRVVPGIHAVEHADQRRRWTTAWKTRCSRRRCRGRSPGTLRTGSTCGDGCRCPSALLPRRVGVRAAEHDGGVPGGVPHGLPVQRGGPGGLPGGHAELAAVSRLLQRESALRTAIPRAALFVGVAVRVQQPDGQFESQCGG